MTALGDLTIRASAILAVALVAVTALRRQSAAVRHAVLAGAVLAALAVLPLTQLLPAWTIPLPRQIASAPDRAGGSIIADVRVGGAAVASAGTDDVDMARVAVAVWAAGAAAFSVPLVISLVRLRLLASGAVPMAAGRWTSIADEIRRGRPAAPLGTDATTSPPRRDVLLLEAVAPAFIATWGVWRPRVLVPSLARDWDEARIRSVLVHELAHVDRLDWATQLAADVLRILQWFNPLAWIVCRRLHTESERACDDAVLGRGVAAETYVNHLVDIARACRASPAPRLGLLAISRESALQRRVSVMLRPDVVHHPLSRRGAVSVALGLLCLAWPAAALKAAPDGPRALSGVVYDPSGAVLPDAAIALEDGQGHRSETATDASGEFEFPAVAPGKYTLAISIPGFRLLSQSLELRQDGDWTRTIMLQLGSVQETITVRSARLPASGATVAPPRVRVGGSIRPPQKLHDVRPVYPESMRAAGIQGVVPLEAIIGTDGSVRSVRVTAGLVHPELAQAAVDAVRQWRFDPTRLNGAPTEVVMNVSITFELED